MARKIISIILMIAGFVTFTIPTFSLLMRPDWIYVEAYRTGIAPFSITLLLAGFLLWPLHPRGLMVKAQGIISLVIAVLGLVFLVYMGYWLSSASMRWIRPVGPGLVGRFNSIIGTIAGLFAPGLVIAVLAAVVAAQRLSGRE
ncbi:MAG: hypothetical protein ACK4WK_02065 [Anaerolineae bacterium]